MWKYPSSTEIVTQITFTLKNFVQELPEETKEDPEYVNAAHVASAALTVPHPQFQSKSRKLGGLTIFQENSLNGKNLSTPLLPALGKPR